MSSRLPTGWGGMVTLRTLDESGYGYGGGVADVVETSDGVGWNGDAPNS